MKLRLGIKSDPIEYRYSFPWLFRLMEEEGVHSLQLGTFFEIYQLEDNYFHQLRQQAADHGISIDSIFTAHRELGGFFREDPAWVTVARRNFERLIEIGAILGAQSVGSNPGAVPRDLMGLKEQGTRCYLQHLKELMAFAKARGIDWLTVEPMSCLAEPPTLPAEVREMGEELTQYYLSNPAGLARVGYCADIAHGYLNQQRVLTYDHVQLFEVAIPYLYEIHLKNTDAHFHSTFGFDGDNPAKGIVDVLEFRGLILAKADQMPVQELGCYLEIGGPKLGRDYTDFQLEDQLRQSLRYLREHFLLGGPSAVPPAPRPVQLRTSPAVEIAPSMMCVGPLNFESALRRVEALGADMLHLDVMDGHFVPNVPMGLSLVEALAARTHLPLDVHLMVSDNDFFVRLLADLRIARIAVHAESCQHLDRVLGQIRDMGAWAGVAINPGTPLSVLDFIMERLDYVLIMTVNPGFAGQKLTPASMRKIADCRALLDRSGYAHIPIQVDGNVSFENIPAMVAAGAANLVGGTSSLFHAGGTWAENFALVRERIRDGLAAREKHQSKPAPSLLAHI